MHDEEVNLEGLPAPLLDVDLDPWGRSVAVWGTDRGASHVVVDGVTTPLGFECQYPILRILGPDHVLLVESRCRADAVNARILRADGFVERAFRVGDAVEDVVIVGDAIVVTYFDEALGSSEGLYSLVMFDRDGKPVLRYADAFGCDLVDCYCACDAGLGRVFSLGYPGFDAVLLDTRTKTRTAWPTPRALYTVIAFDDDARG